MEFRFLISIDIPVLEAQHASPAGLPFLRHRVGKAPDIPLTFDPRTKLYRTRMKDTSLSLKTYLFLTPFNIQNRELGRVSTEHEDASWGDRDAVDC